MAGRYFPSLSRARSSRPPAGRNHGLPLCLRDAIPWLDALRFTNTGTEATMQAIRLARAVTGRDLMVKFEGAYHEALVEARS